MKKILFIAALIFGCLSFKIADAQVGFHVGVNIGSQPEWGPVGHPSAAYYYMPDIDAYYDVPNHQYVYSENNVWVHNRELPARYANYDRYHSYKVVVNQRNPWEHHEQIRTRYAGYRGRHDQQIIRESRDERYRNHWREEGHREGDHRDDHYHDHGGHDRH
jgi:hypothetical protein